MKAPNDNEKSYLGLVRESATDSHSLRAMARGYCVVCDVGFGLLEYESLPNFTNRKR